jgi:pseudoazurin
MKKLFRILAVIVGAGVPLIGSAYAGEMRVESLNKVGDQRFVYAPNLVHIQPGDTVVFVPTDKGHNTVSIDGMLPEGAKRISIGFNKQGAVVFDRPGIYGFKCTPHVGLGMVGLVVVGDPAGSDEIRRAAAKLPPKARERIYALLTQLES